MNIRNVTIILLFSIILVIGLGACGNSPSINTLLPPEGSINSTQPTTTVLAKPSNTLTPIPATPTMPLPTFSVEEKENIVTKLVTEDFNCMLPCWGGIEAGVTTWSNAQTFLEQFTQIYSSPSGIRTAEIHYKDDDLVLEFYAKSNVVEFMGVPRFEYPIHHLFRDYGRPDEIYFFILDVLPVDTTNPYSLYLIYKEKGIIAEYNGVSAKGRTLLICFRDFHDSKSRNVFLWLWAKEDEKTFHNVISQYMDRFSEHSSLTYYKLEELSVYNPNDFFDIYSLEENENSCLKIKNPNPEPG